MRHVTRADYLAMPWKNGKGVTLEIGRAPAAPLDYAWRLSLASIDADGAFSHFGGYQRLVVLVEGAGFTLEMGAPGSARLAEPGDGAVFAGDLPVHCRLHAGACRDLSLMTRFPGTVWPARVIDVPGSACVDTEPGVQRALYALAGDCRVGAQPLAVGDTLFLEPGDGAVELSAGTAAARLIVLRWTVAA